MSARGQETGSLGGTPTLGGVPGAADLDAEVAAILGSPAERPLARVADLLLARLTWSVAFVMLRDDFQVLDHLPARSPSRVVEPRPGTVDPVRFALSRGGREVFRLAPGDVVRGTLTAQLLDHLHRDPAHRLGATRPRRAANAAVGCATDVLIAPLAGKDRTLGLLVARPADPADATGPAPVELSDVAATLIRVAERVGGAWQGAQDAGAAPVRQPWWRGGHPNRGAAYRAEGLQHRWDLPFDPGSVSVARTLVGEACRNWGASAPVRTVELVTSELVANAVRHGWGGVRVTVSATETGILVEVLDGSPEPPVCRRGGEVPMGGYGIRIVEQLATWGWRRERVGKTVWALVPRA